MAHGHINTPPFTGIAGADLRGKEGFFVKPTANGYVLAGSGELAFPLLIGANTGQALTLGSPGGTYKMKSLAGIANGALIKAGTGGKAATAVATAVAGAAVTGSNVLGIAHSATNNADEIVSVYFHPMGALVTTAS
jgi:hypothetical protein